MFCPNCGVEDVKSSQFCRACGAELLVVRTALDQRADTGPIEANTAREEIGRALADKIRQFETAADLKLAVNEILPAVERFLETPEEKRLRGERLQLEIEQNRLRRARQGLVTSAVGFIAALAFLLAGTASRDPVWIVPFAPSAIAFLVGVGIIINALFFAPSAGKQKDSAPASGAAVQIGIFRLPRKEHSPDQIPAQLPKKELGPADPHYIPSVTEGTTRQL